MRATIYDQSASEHVHLRWLVGAFIQRAPLDVWRHAGIGALQAYIREGDRDELRVHVWHPSLVAPGIRASGDVHDHRFDLESHVLVGAIDHVEYEATALVPAEGGGWHVRWPYPLVPDDHLWQMHEVTHARKALETVGTHHLPHPPLPERYAVSTESWTIVAGQTYTFPKRRFHATRAGALAITLVRKRDQEGEPPARVLSPVSAPLVHAFDAPRPASEWAHLLETAARECLL